MLYNFFRVGLVSLFLFNLNAIAEPSLPTISEEEANKYEVEYLKEYEELKKTSNDSLVKWIQPKNKKEACKIYCGVDPKNDYTLKDDYALYWDGECKDGYAYGLGREMEYRDYSYRYQIGIYKNGMPENYCASINEAEGITIEGECHYSNNQANYNTVTIIQNKEADLLIEYRYGFGSNQSPLLTTYSSPFFENIKLIKEYPNFRYEIIDSTKNDLNNKNYTFAIIKDKKINGFAFQINKDGQRYGAEILNGTRQRKVELPQSYYNKVNKILQEIKEAGNKALDAQEKARIIKTKYKMKICKEKVKVNFMDNEEYKAICQEDKKMEELRVKINQKLDRLNLVKQQKLQQMNEEKRLKAEQNANAKAEELAKQRAAIAEETLEEQRRANLNQGFQNLNQTLQLQQMNRNMSWDALTPKRFDVYMH